MDDFADHRLMELNDFTGTINDTTIWAVGNQVNVIGGKLNNQISEITISISEISEIIFEICVISD